MRVLIISCFIFLLSMGTSFALSLADNGYAWNSSSYEERTEICKLLASKIGKDYVWWLGALNAAYNTTEPSILNGKIGEAAALLPLFDQNDQ